MISKIKAEGEKKEEELRSKLHSAKKQKKELELKLSQLQNESVQLESTLNKMRNELSLAENESNRIKQLVLTEKESFKFNQLEEQKLEKKRIELEKQLMDLENEENQLDNEERELDKKCASVRAALDEVQRRRITSGSGSFKLSDTLEGIDNIEKNHSSVLELEKKASKLMKKCQDALEELRNIRRDKIGPENLELLQMIEKKEDQLMNLHKNLFIKND